MKSEEMKRAARLLDHRVRVSCTDGTGFTGVWVDWISGQDNEPDPESILLEMPQAGLMEVFVEDIVSIEEEKA